MTRSQAARLVQASALMAKACRLRARVDQELGDDPARWLERADQHAAECGQWADVERGCVEQDGTG